MKRRHKLIRKYDWSENCCGSKIPMETKMIHKPAQHQTDPAKLPGQVVNHIPALMLSQPKSAAYKSTHGRYPDVHNAR
jgi:hypothetical protein